MKEQQITAIVLAAGQGSRMKSKIQKQYMEVGGRPLICYALKAFEDSPVDQIILVTGEDQIEHCRKEIVERYHFTKIKAIVPGGRERYHSVYEGLKAAEGSDHVLIHDGARPCVTVKNIEDAIAGAMKYQACVIAVPVKDTIKISDDQQFAEKTPDRNRLWSIQTPQAFSYPLIRDAYEKLMNAPQQYPQVTDDAMAAECTMGIKVKLIPGNYENIKVTTPEDISLAEVFLKKMQKFEK